MNGHPGLHAQSKTTDHAQPVDRVPSLGRLLRVWIGIAVQSFGGGTATQYLIYQAFVERRKWISTEEFTRAWAICPLTPGINLLALAVLIGWRLAGPVGVAVSLLGLLLPSATITVGMTALYSLIRELPLVQAALRGVIPATAGLGLLMAWRMAQPLFATSRKEGRSSLLVSAGLLLTSGVLATFFNPPVILVLLGAGVVAAAASWRRSSSPGA